MAKAVDEPSVKKPDRREEVQDGGKPLATSSTSTGRRHRVLVWFWHIATIGTGLGLGFSLLMLGHKYYGWKVLPAPIVANDFGLVTTPDIHFSDKIVAAISKSHSEILVSAKRVSSLVFVSALVNAQARGVSVKMMVTPEAYATGLPGKLVKAGLKSVRVDTLESGDQFFIIDQKYVFFSTIPFTANDPVNQAGAGILVANTKLASELRDNFIERFNRGKSP